LNRSGKAPIPNFVHLVINIGPRENVLVELAVLYFWIMTKRNKTIDVHSVDTEGRKGKCVDENVNSCTKFGLFRSL